MSYPVAYFIHKSLYLLVPFPSTAPPPSFSPLGTTSLFSMIVCLLLFCCSH